MRNSPIVRYILHNQIIEALLLICIAWFVFAMRDILLALFISYIIMAALSPMVEFLRRYKIPKALAVAISYLTALMIVVVLVVPLIPFFISQIQSLLVDFPVYFNKAANIMGFNLSTNQLQDLVASEFNLLGKNAISVTTKVFGGIISVLTILVVSFYLMLDHQNIKQGIVSWFSPNHRKDALDTLLLVEYKLGAWVRGQIVLCFFIGALTWIVLTLLGVQFALPLAVIAGLLEVIPTIGPIVSAVPAVIVTLAVSPHLTIFVIIAYFLIQLVENNLLVPKIMEKAVGLNPIVIIIGVILGSEMMGILGALLSVPFLSMIVILMHSLKKFEK